MAYGGDRSLPLTHWLPIAYRMALTSILSVLKQRNMQYVSDTMNYPMHILGKVTSIYKMHKHDII